MQKVIVNPIIVFLGISPKNTISTQNKSLHKAAPPCSTQQKARAKVSCAQSAVTWKLLFFCNSP